MMCVIHNDDRIRGGNFGRGSFMPDSVLTYPEDLPACYGVGPVSQELRLADSAPPSENCDPFSRVPQERIEFQ